MRKSLFGGGVIATLLVAFLIFYASPSVAETLAKASQGPASQHSSRVHSAENAQTQTAPTALSAPSSDAPLEEVNPATTRLAVSPSTASEEGPADVLVAPPQSFVATAYSLRGRTASGKSVAKGIIAADRTVLPLGTRVRLEAGAYSGEYLVADTGGAIRGRKIDIWVPNTAEALRFGRRAIKLTVLKYGGRKMASLARARR